MPHQVVVGVKGGGRSGVQIRKKVIENTRKIQQSGVVCQKSKIVIRIWILVYAFGCLCRRKREWGGKW